jgi:uncharacterized protein (DUF1330 family)
MTVYAIAQITIHDRARYDRYASRFLGVLSRYKGRLLAADESPRVIEGAWDHEKAIVIAFEDVASFEAWMTSEEYAEIAKDRLAATRGSVILVRGFARGPA